MRVLEERTGKQFGGATNPLLVSVRSGARVSMPGMMDTILNLGLNDRTVAGLALLTGNDRFAWDAYRRFVAMFSNIVLGIDKHEFEAAIDRAKEACACAPIPKSTRRRGATWSTSSRASCAPVRGASFPKTCTSSHARRAGRVRVVALQTRGRLPRLQQDPRRLGTAVNICVMVFGNMSEDSGNGSRLHARPQHRGPGNLRRVLAQRAR